MHTRAESPLIDLDAVALAEIQNPVVSSPYSPYQRGLSYSIAVFSLSTYFYIYNLLGAIIYERHTARQLTS